MFADQLNQTYFNGRLSSESLSLLQDLDNQSSEVRKFVERIFRFMKIGKFRAIDFSPILAWAIGFMPQRILPEAWGGIIPPITVEGRHSKIDEYLTCNPWFRPAESCRFLDLGCGFPPLTTIETAEKFPAWRVIGSDPSFGKYMLYDEKGDYACFDENGKLHYFQPAVREWERWQSLYRDHASTTKRFTALFQKFSSILQQSDSNRDRIMELENARLVQNPMREYERENLSFIEGGLGTLDVQNIDIARCLNVLIYFDRQFWKRILDWMAHVLNPNGIFITGMDWIKSTQSRYTVHQKVEDRLIAQEFAMSIDNLRPLGIVSWFALHDDDYETNLMSQLCGVIRSNQEFCQQFDLALDRLLSEKRICERNAEGYLGTLLPGTEANELEARFMEILDSLNQQGFVDRAVAVLKAAGYDAWQNCVGHIAIAPQSIHV